MFSLLSANATQGTLGFLEALELGGQTVLLGMLTVFAVLVIIWAAMVLFKVFLYDIPNKKKESTTVTPEPTPVITKAAQKNDEEIVAVIAAAIAMAESEAGDAKFRVVSFRRK